MRLAFKVLLWCLTPPLLLVVAWVACNVGWADAPPQPVPAELALRPIGLAPSRNAFYDLQGLTAPATEDANAWGQAHIQESNPSGDAEPLRWPTDTLWQCKPAESSCVRHWRGERRHMVELLAATQDLGRRCESIAAADGIEEVVIERPARGPLSQVAFAALPFPRYAGVSGCLRWFGVRAALAPNPREAMAELAKADRLARLVLAGSRNLIGTMVGVAGVQNNWLLAAGVVEATPDADRNALLPLLAPLPGQALDPRIWVPVEARFFREVVQDMTQDERGCESGSPESASAERLWCRLKLGLLPELSKRRSDARWLARLAAVPPGGFASCDQVALPVWRETERPWPAWRNTLGQLMLDVPGNDWTRYTARQLDIELLRRTLRAQITSEAVPADVQLSRDAGVQLFAACRARLDPGTAGTTLRLPVF